MPASAQPAAMKELLPQMSDKRVQIYDLYLTAWSAVPDSERAQLLRQSLSDQIVFTNSIQTRRGLSDVDAHLKAFQIHIPGASFRLKNMLGWGTYALAEWQLVDAEGKPGFTGYDVLTFDEQGLISTILMFINEEAQKARLTTV